MIDDYAALLQKLFALVIGRSGCLDLSLMKTLCNAIGNPHRKFASVHIAGTNGKGSVATALAAALASRYRRVGLYTSPHISSFRERIRLNNIPIPTSEVERLLPRLFAILDALALPASFFEITTALAFLYWAEQKVEIAVVEVGLGGRLDATNIIDSELAVITSISADHTELLGDSLEMIAREKAGIIKEGKPIVIGPTVPKQVIQPIADKKKAPLYIVEGVYSDYREENRAVASEAMHHLGIDPAAHSEALHTLPPCRFEEHTIDGVLLFLDVAHNPAGTQKLADLIRHRCCRCHILLAISSNKELESSLAPLCTIGSHWYPVEAPNGRSYPAEHVAKALLKGGVLPSALTYLPTIASALNSAIQGARNVNVPVLVCGSFFIMAEVRRYLGLIELSDHLELNEQFVPTMLPLNTL